MPALKQCHKICLSFVKWRIQKFRQHLIMIIMECIKNIFWQKFCTFSKINFYYYILALLKFLVYSSAHIWEIDLINTLAGICNCISWLLYLRPDSSECTFWPTLWLHPGYSMSIIYPNTLEHISHMFRIEHTM